jgi:hypothetical protein
MPSKHRIRRKRARDAPKPNSDGSRLTHDQRIRIRTLYFDSGWGYTAISNCTKIDRSAVRRAIKSFITPQKPRGRPPIIDTPKRQRLIKRATIDGYHRRLGYVQIATIEGIQACRRTLKAAFIKEQYFRRVASEKPFLTEKHQQDRLQWAYLHKDWNEWQWARVIWTDECSIALGSSGQVYITRQAEEKYLPACCVPKFRKSSAYMIWGSITSYGTGPLVVFEKDWGTITGDVYRQNIVPVIHAFKQAHTAVVQGPPILMEDGAAPHRARQTQALHEQLGILKMNWPANSPDLNPIENVWRLLKYRIGLRFPRTAEQVRLYAREEWEKLRLVDFSKYVHNMRERCLAVIAANGGPTRW